LIVVRIAVSAPIVLSMHGIVHHLMTNNDAGMGFRHALPTGETPLPVACLVGRLWRTVAEAR
jgi:hypothetical protein